MNLVISSVLSAVKAHVLSFINQLEPSQRLKPSSGCYQARTLEGVCELLVEQPVGDLLNVLRQRVAGALVHCLLCDLVR